MIKKTHWPLSLVTPSLGYKGLEKAQCLKNLYRSCLLMGCSFANIDSSISQKVLLHVVTITRICLFQIPSFLSVSVFLSDSLSPLSVCMYACLSLPSSIFVSSSFFFPLCLCLWHISYSCFAFCAFSKIGSHCFLALNPLLTQANLYFVTLLLMLRLHMYSTTPDLDTPIASSGCVLPRNGSTGISQVLK